MDDTTEKRVVSATMNYYAWAVVVGGDTHSLKKKKKNINKSNNINDDFFAICVFCSHLFHPHKSKNANSPSNRNVIH